MTVVKLRRGPWSRLFGDAMPLGLSSQFLVIVAIGLLSPIEGWRWLPLVLVVSLAVIAVSWTYKLEGCRLTGGVFGLTFLDVDLRGATVRLEAFPVGYVATADIVVIDGADIRRRVTFWDRHLPEVRLGYSMWIGRKRRELWLREILSRTGVTDGPQQSRSRKSRRR